MKAILMSIQQQHVVNILNGEKTDEIRKTAPRVRKEYLGKGAYGLGKRYKLHQEPYEVYIYCTKSSRDQYLSRTEDRKFVIVHSHVHKEHPFRKNSEWNGKVVAKFTLNQVRTTCGWRLKGDTGRLKPRQEWESNLPKTACLSIEEMIEYAGGSDKNVIKDWVISDLQVFEKPKELGEFWTKRKCTSCKDSGYEVSACVFDEDCKVPVRMERPPQSWQFVEVGR